MKKKGFTLVELLAVIAILAILVIIALPNIMSLFNEAKKRSFTNEIKELFKTAENQWMSDSMINTKDMYYSRTVNASGADNVLACVSGTNNSSLKLSGRTQLKYGIKVNKAGTIVSFVATDGTYMYRYNGDGLKIESIGTGTKASSEVESTNYVISLADNGKTSALIECDGAKFKITAKP